MPRIIDYLKNFETFVLDCDGVLYKGNNPIKGAKEVVEVLKDEGKEVKFLTNYPYSREKIKQKLKNVVDIEASEEDIMTVAFATAKYIQENKTKNNETVYVFGFDELKKEIENTGLKVLEREEIMNEDFELIQLPDWLVISLYEGSDYYKNLAAAGLVLRNEKFDASHYLATSKGKIWTREKGLSPGVGCTIAALYEFSGKKPIIVGKPGKILTDIAFKYWKINPEKSVLVGDKWSDIEVANNYGLYGIKVETGKQDFFNGVETLNEYKKPKMVLKSIRGIIDESEIIYFEK
ncbi:MAG TPA: HAD-IIA family hydrolase [Nanoarchaeota archaeon]|nr:HAD-IIA family hydrolase [Nanoarchaeota archaeon]